MSNSGLYIQLWKTILPEIYNAIDNNITEVKLKEADFTACGNRQSYAFRLDIANGFIPIKEGSAVARDLRLVLESSLLFKAFAKDKNITLRLTSNFILEILIHN